MWLPSNDMAVTRVANRVRQGGRKVPESDIRRRFITGIRNMFGLYRPLVDGWWLYDASQLPPQLIANADGNKVRVRTVDLYQQIISATEE